MQLVRTITCLLSVIFLCFFLKFYSLCRLFFFVLFVDPALDGEGESNETGDATNGKSK